MSLDALKALVIDNAADFANVNSSDIKVLETTPETVAGGDAAATVVYSVPYKHANFIFANTIVMNKHRETQVVTFTINQSYSDADRALHAEFLAATRFE
jgi:hypothetical protein